MRRVAVVGVAAAAVVAVASAAVAYFGVFSSTTNATAVAQALGTPSLALSGSPSPDGVSLSVGAPASGIAPAAYRVDRTAPTAVTGVCTMAVAGTCTDAAPVAGQQNTYAVYALRHAWASFVPATLDVAVPAETRSFALTPSTATPTAGTAFTVTVTAKNGAATDTTYSGSKTLVWSGGQTVGSFAPSYQTAVTFTNGVATATVTLYQAGAQTLVATDSAQAAYTGSAEVTVSRASVALTLTCPATAPKSSAVSATLGRPATDAYGNVVTGEPVAVTVSATFATPASQTVTVASGATTQAFTVTMSNANRTTVLTTNAPTGYTAAPACSTVHT